MKTFYSNRNGVMLRIVYFVAALLLLFSSGCDGRAQRGMESENVKKAGTEHKELWTCSMHPQVIQDHPGSCPICHMELVPLARDAAISDKPETLTSGVMERSHTVTIDPALVQNMGIRSARATKIILTEKIRAAGTLVEPESSVREINLLVNGWIKKLHVNAEGLLVKKGDPLFDVYSPELSVAVRELINAQKAANTSSAFSELYQASKKKLLLWGLSNEDIATIEKQANVKDVVTFRSPIAGSVIKKNITEGASVKAGDQVFQIAELTTLWVNAQLYESQLSQLAIGQEAAVLVAGKIVRASIIFIDPRLDPQTRTTKVRLQVPNSDLFLKPQMFATVTIEVPSSAPVIAIPREAVIDTGKRQIAFVRGEQGRFSLREVHLGRQDSEGFVEVLHGIVEGDDVVTSGQFLLDSESRLREAVQKFLNDQNYSANTYADSTKEVVEAPHTDHGAHHHD